MLITSLLHILNRRAPDSKVVTATTGSEEFQTRLKSASAQELSPEANERQNEGPGAVRPAPPADVSLPAVSGQRGMDFIRALEDAEKEERPPLLDVFE